MQDVILSCTEIELNYFTGGCQMVSLKEEPP
jgi:hypothetical protein